MINKYFDWIIKRHGKNDAAWIPVVYIGLPAAVLNGLLWWLMS